jgi:LysR family transcriptional regulator, transcriptional activator for dmlA
LRQEDYTVAAPDLNDVRTFAVAADAGTFSEAARELRVPASTISRSLSRLEKHLGVQLVQRSPKGFRLTESGRDYLDACKRALRALKEGGEQIDSQARQPAGLIRVACPITMARDFLAPLLKEFLRRYPDLRLEIEPYASGWDQEPREDVDVFFKLRAPRDSSRRMRSYPGTARGLFASPEYIQAFGNPAKPEDLTGHKCIGSGVWKLTRGKSVIAPNVSFCIVTSDPHVHLTLALEGVGICILPLWMAGWPEVRKRLVPVLPLWKPEPITVCALFFGQARATPKVQALLDFLAEYMGTDRDPRLRQRWAKEYFTPISIAPTSGP